MYFLFPLRTKPWSVTSAALKLRRLINCVGSGGHPIDESFISGLESKSAESDRQGHDNQTSIEELQGRKHSELKMVVNGTLLKLNSGARSSYYISGTHIDIEMG
ncbi:hypothetical protein KP79_PYT10965 [Mizuhopecten yessoensis]|uniref:Uncharacterized protein n=1 Tax=Mizuhopecten yessoensis TaxID=6573 RepID=A0A210PI10_MIZYE|nr:hypothetical protein KP79_PYT10965 [Mizuhopecten yessoensis]